VVHSSIRVQLHESVCVEVATRERPVGGEPKREPATSSVSLKSTSDAEIPTNPIVNSMRFASLITRVLSIVVDWQRCRPLPPPSRPD
jgi:hypothetical protein